MHSFQPWARWAGRLIPIPTKVGGVVEIKIGESWDFPPFNLTFSLKIQNFPKKSSIFDPKVNENWDIPILPDFRLKNWRILWLPSTSPNFSQKYKSQDDRSRPIQNVGMGRDQPSWPNPDPSRPNFCQDFIPLEISRPWLINSILFEEIGIRVSASSFSAS